MSSGSFELKQDQISVDSGVIAQQHKDQSHSAIATKFSLASLLSSSSSDPTAPVSIASSISLPNTTQSVYDEHDVPVSQPPHNALLLPNPAQAHRLNYNGLSVSTEKSLNPGNCEQLTTETWTTANSSEDTIFSQDGTNSKAPACENNSASSITLSSNQKTNTGINQTVHTFVSASAATPCGGDDDSSSRTKAGGLVDLLTTAVEDKDSTLLLGSIEDKWMSQSLKEVSDPSLTLTV